MPPLRWGVLGTGSIASDFCEALRSSSLCVVTSVAGSSADKAREFAGRFVIPRWSGSVRELLDDDGVDAVYIAKPHPSHQ